MRSLYSTLCFVVLLMGLNAHAGADPEMVDPSGFDNIEINSILPKYNYLDPQHVVPQTLIETAVVYFAANRTRFPNQNYLTIVDFKPRSDENRLFLINLRTGGVETYHTSHGNGSVSGDPAYAVQFGNVPESNRSSLGFVKTGEVFVGSLQRALRLDGLSETNSNLRRRGILVHGSDQVHESNVIQGVSGGCIMLDFAVRDLVIDKIKGGSLMYMGYSGKL